MDFPYVCFKHKFFCGSRNSVSLIFIKIIVNFLPVFCITAYAIDFTSSNAQQSLVILLLD